MRLMLSHNLSCTFIYVHKLGLSRVPSSYRTSIITQNWVPLLPWVHLGQIYVDIYLRHFFITLNLSCFVFDTNVAVFIWHCLIMNKLFDAYLIILCISLDYSNSIFLLTFITRANKSFSLIKAINSGPQILNHLYLIKTRRRELEGVNLCGDLCCPLYSKKLHKENTLRYPLQLQQSSTPQRKHDLHTVPSVTETAILRNLHATIACRRRRIKSLMYFVYVQCLEYE